MTARGSSSTESPRAGFGAQSPWIDPPTAARARPWKDDGFPAGFRFAELAALALPSIAGSTGACSRGKGRGDGSLVHRKRAEARPSGQHPYHSLGRRLENAGRSPHGPWLLGTMGFEGMPALAGRRAGGALEFAPKSGMRERYQASSYKSDRIKEP